MSDLFNLKNLPTDLKPAVVDLLYRLADDSILIGHRNSEWTGIGPILEEDIAFSSMAQDKMGHAAAYYTLLHELGEQDPDTLAFMRDAHDFRCCQFVALGNIAPDAPAESPDNCNNPTRDRLMAHGDWAISFVRQFLFVQADVVRNSALESSRYDPLASLCRKIRGELRYHTMHAESTLRHLAHGTDDSRDRIKKSFVYLWPYALGLFEATAHDQALADACICPTQADLQREWRARIDPMLADAGLTIDESVQPKFGGRTGKHEQALVDALADMQKVYRLEPTATW